MTPVNEILTRIRRRMKDSGLLISGILACDSDGKPVPVRSPEAVAWNTMGAIAAECRGITQLCAETAVASAIDGDPTVDIYEWHNSRESLDDVLAVLDKAIAAAGGQAIAAGDGRRPRTLRTFLGT